MVAGSFCPFHGIPGLSKGIKKYLYTMELQLPVKSLSRLNWLLAVLIGMFEFLSLQLTRKEVTADKAWAFALMSAVVMALVGFGNIAILIRGHKRYGGRSRSFRIYYLFVSYIYTLAVIMLLWPIFAHLAHQEWKFTDRTLLATFLLSSIPLDMIVITLHGIVILQYAKVSSDTENAQLRIAHAEAANQLLRQQIHPHLLFNALNTLKSLYKKDVHAGETYLVHLANFLRAAMSEDTHKISRLSDELKLCNDYLEMQKMRFGEALICRVNIPEELTVKGFVPSFSLQPLLENAIKHNEITEEFPLQISISTSGDRIIVANNLQLKQHKEISTGKGLANLAERYRIGSGDEVIIKDDNNEFSVSIKILSHGDSDYRG
jgi:sensor histidine kinase YesM